MSVLVVSKILRPFLNTLTRNDKDVFSVKGEFKGTNSKGISEKTKDIFWIFYCISEIYIYF